MINVEVFPALNSPFPMPTQVSISPLTLPPLPRYRQGCFSASVAPHKAAAPTLLPEAGLRGHVQRSVVDIRLDIWSPKDKVPGHAPLLHIPCLRVQNCTSKPSCPQLANCRSNHPPAPHRLLPNEQGAANCAHNWLIELTVGKLLLQLFVHTILHLGVIVGYRV